MKNLKYLWIFSGLINGIMGMENTQKNSSLTPNGKSEESKKISCNCKVLPQIFCLKITELNPKQEKIKIILDEIEKQVHKDHELDHELLLKQWSLIIDHKEDNISSILLFTESLSDEFLYQNIIQQLNHIIIFKVKKSLDLTEFSIDEIQINDIFSRFLSWY